MPDNPFAPAQVSPWVVSTPGPELVKHQVKSSGKQQLLAEAAQLQPDQAALVKQLTDLDLDPMTSKIFGEQLNQGLKGFSEEYSKNPFYAFSRDGRNTVSALQQMVRDPKLGASAKAYKESQEQRKEMQKNNMLKMADVQGGMVRVIDKDTGELDFVLPESLKNGNYYVPTIDELHNYMYNQKGFYHKDLSKIVPIGHNMIPKTKVDEEAMKWFDGLGKHVQETLGSLVDTKTSTNQAQIMSAINGLLDNNSGLSQAARDTIYSGYYSSTDPKQATSDGAKMALVKYVYDLANRKIDTAIDYKASAAGEGGLNAMQTKNLTQNGDIGNAATNVVNNTHYWEFGMPQFGAGVNATIPYSDVNKQFFEETGNITWKDGDQVRPAATLGTVQGLKPVAKSDYWIADRRDGHQGEFVPLPDVFKDNLTSLVVDLDKDNKYIPQMHMGTVTDYNGNKTSGLLAPGHGAVKYEMGDDGKLHAANPSKQALAMNIVARAGQGNDKWSKAIEQMVEYGYAKEIASLTSRELDAIDAQVKAAGGLNPGADAWGWGVGAPVGLADNDGIKFEVFATFDNPAALDAAAKGLPASFRGKAGLPDPNLAMHGGESNVGERKPFDKSSFFKKTDLGSLE